MSRKVKNSIKSRVDDLRNWNLLFVAETIAGTLCFGSIDYRKTFVILTVSIELPRWLIEWF